MVTELFPEVALGLHLAPGCLEQRTAQLLNLIYEEANIMSRASTTDRFCPPCP